MSRHFLNPYQELIPPGLITQNDARIYHDHNSNIRTSPEPIGPPPFIWQNQGIYPNHFLFSLKLIILFSMM